MKVLITGAHGQIGTELVLALRKRYGVDQVIATDIRHLDNEVSTKGIFIKLDVMDRKEFEKIAKEHNVEVIIHLAALLSATAESNPQFAWDLNMGGLLNGLEVARELNAMFFTPSSIGAFGQQTPKENTPQVTIQRPDTMYGINKVASELLCDYYYKKYDIDTRGIRFPGLISHLAPPGGGTTDYAVDIFHQAVMKQQFICNLEPGTYLDMMYMSDAVSSIIQLIEADSDKLVNRNAYNISAMSVEPDMIANEIKKHIPEFDMIYNIDERLQEIANSWPNSIDTSCAKEEFGFEPTYDLESMTRDMISKLKVKYKEKII
ncbi:MAG TPA: NAD-dependent epimerase/dehydratase family protein [Pseudogracilibacillus sp.]|nr:NAD-dependent epimerase/dehydratase family protein [Pseudogracilibacillus sp.]